MNKATPGSIRILHPADDKPNLFYFKYLRNIYV